MLNWKKLKKFLPENEEDGSDAANVQVNIYRQYIDN